MDRRTFLASSFTLSLGLAADPSPLFAEAVPDNPSQTAGAGAAADEARATQAADALTPAQRSRLAHDPLRPQFHLLPRHNWMNDPCAPRFHNGQYHMFFQYNPHAAVWGDMHWNHATSPDLVHWTHLPVALAPTRDSYDAFGCFTGSVLPGAPVASILYTGVTRSSPEMETIRGEGTREVQCLATSTDPQLRTWTKLPAPVIPAPPPGVKVTGFRDPCPWKEGDTWYLIVGSGFNRVGGAVLLYQSTDARHWTYLHPLAQGEWNGGSQTNPVDTGEMWECPDFFPLGNKHVLLYSTERKVYWEVGTFDRQALRFERETRGLLDQGSYYAMKSMEDARGRRILWGWVEETRNAEACLAAGWAGCMALPRILTLGEDNHLRMDVPHEFAALQGARRSLPARVRREDVGASSTGVSLPIHARACHIEFSFAPGNPPFTLEVVSSDDEQAVAVLRFNGDTKAPSLAVNQPQGPKAGKPLGFALQPGPQATTVRMWIDGSVFEIIADGREAITLRDYSAGELRVRCTGPTRALPSLDVYDMAAISPDRLTS